MEKADLDKLRALETKMDALKATEFTGSVGQLPSVGEIESADTETLITYNAQFADTAKLYEGLTESQRKKVAEQTIKQYENVKQALETASKKAGLTTEGSGDDAENDVAALLQKILEELKAQNKPETENPDDAGSAEGEDSSESTEGTANS